MGYRHLRLCSGGGGYEALPDPGPPLDLGALADRLRQEGFPVVDARVLLIVGLDLEVTISRSGRLLFKTPEERRAADALERLAPFLRSASDGGRPPTGRRSR
jgi:hypothetical protein